MRRKGYTLVELIVVIGILAVVASILFPALSAAKDRANAAVCTSNLHQLGLGMELYHADNGVYPAPMVTSFDSYISNAKLICPAAPGAQNFSAYGDLASFNWKFIQPEVQAQADSLRKCFEKRGAEFPLLVDLNHLPKILRPDDLLPGFVLVYRVSGAVNWISKQRVAEVEAEANGLSPAVTLPCSPSAGDGNL